MKNLFYSMLGKASKHTMQHHVNLQKFIIFLNRFSLPTNKVLGNLGDVNSNNINIPDFALPCFGFCR